MSAANPATLLAGNIALAVASSGVAALVLHGGRTAHSRYAIPMSIWDFETPCHMLLESPAAELIRRASLCVWDELPMASKYQVAAVDRLLQFVCERNEPFGGKTFLFGGKCNLRHEI